MSRRSPLTGEPGGYRWTCPFCGIPRLNTSSGERGSRMRPPRFERTSSHRMATVTVPGGGSQPRSPFHSPATLRRWSTIDEPAG